MRTFATAGPVNPKDHYYVPHRLDGVLFIINANILVLKLSAFGVCKKYSKIYEVIWLVKFLHIPCCLKYVSNVRFSAF
jgi:hypothetical protein